MTDETGMILMARGNVQEMFDIIVGSLDFGSGFLYEDQIQMLRAVAEQLGVNPMVATPSNYSKSYPHAFEAKVIPGGGEVTTWCKYCIELPDKPWHNVAPEAS